MMGFDELQESQEEVYKLRDKIDALEATVERLMDVLKSTEECAGTIVDTVRYVLSNESEEGG